MFDLSEIQQKILQSLAHNDQAGMTKIIKKIQTADFAEAICDLKTNQILAIFMLLSAYNAAQILVYSSLECQIRILKNLQPFALKQIISKIYSDDLIDILNNLPLPLVKRILATLSPKKRADLNKILRHDEETAGGMMSVNFVSILETNTATKTLKILRETYQNFENVDTLFVIDRYGHLKGRLDFKNLVFAAPQSQIRELMDQRLLSVKVNDDREDVIKVFKKYDVSVLPVLEASNKMVGFISVDDVLDGLEEESTEDITNLAGIRHGHAEFFKMNVWKIFKSRLFWLLGAFLIGTLSQILILVFYHAYQVPVVLSSKAGVAIILLAPMLLTLASVLGVSANQSATTMVRALAIDPVSKKEFWQTFAKEILVAFWLAIILILFNLLRLVLIYCVEFPNPNQASLWKAFGISSITLMIGLIFGNILGSLLPVMAKILKLDPTLVCTPLISTLLDIITVSLLFGLGLAFY